MLTETLTMDKKMNKEKPMTTGEISRLILLDLSEDTSFTEKYRKALKLAAAHKI
jgi:hypothetical protein